MTSKQSAIVVDAIEAFIKATVTYERRLCSDPEWANPVDVNETREHLRFVLEMLPKGTVS